MEPDESRQLLTGIPLETARLCLGWPSRKELALLALLRGATLTVAADEAGVTRQTVSGWVNGDEEFAAEYQARREELWESCRRGLEARLCETVDVLGALLRDRNPFVRLGASRVLVDVLAQRVPAGKVPTAPGEANVSVARRILAEPSA